MASKSANARAQRAPVRNGSKLARATYPIIAIDPGNPVAYALHVPGRSPMIGLLSGTTALHGILSLYLPCHVFIEAPVGGDPFLRDMLGRVVESIIGELSPFDRDRQLIPISVWRLEVLGKGDVKKDAAIKWARGRYPKAYGELGFESHDVAEALCIAEYGRRVVTGRLQHGPPGVKLPRYELAPPTRRSRFKPKYRLDRDGGIWPDPPPEPPWLLIRKHGGETLAGIVRLWASCYEAVTVHCEERDQRFSLRDIAADARVRPESVPEYLKALVDAGVAYKDQGWYVFRRVTEGTIYNPRSDRQPFDALFAPFMPKPVYIEGSPGYVCKSWLRGGDPALKPSHWKREDWRKRDARYGRLACPECGWYEPPYDGSLCERCAERLEAAEEPAPLRRPAHGEDDHENDGECADCADEEADFLDSPEAEQYVSMAKDGHP